MSLRCGCPVDTSAKQKHRPSREARPPSGVRQSVFLFKGITDSFALCAQNDIPFSYCNHRGMRSKPSSCHCEGAGVRWTPLRSRSTDRAGRRDHRQVCGNPFSFLRVLRILSRLPLLRCPKVVIRLEREQFLTAASAVARFFQHCSESNVTRNDKKLTGYAMNVKS